MAREPKFEEYEEAFRRGFIHGFVRTMETLKRFKEHGVELDEPGTLAALSRWRQAPKDQMLDAPPFCILGDDGDKE